MIDIAVLYDTSYLMAERGNIFEGVPEECQDYLNVWHYIPEEVQVEIARHIKNDEDQERNRLARAARALYVKMSALPNFSSDSLRDVSIPEIHERILGPDSDTDKKLIGFADQLLSKNKAQIVYVATRDAGIGAELVFQSTRNGKPVYCDLVRSQFVEKMRELTAPAIKERCEKEEQEVRAAKEQQEAEFHARLLQARTSGNVHSVIDEIMKKQDWRDLSPSEAKYFDEHATKSDLTCLQRVRQMIFDKTLAGQTFTPLEREYLTKSESSPAYANHAAALKKSKAAADDKQLKKVGFWASVVLGLCGAAAAIATIKKKNGDW